MFGLKKNTKNEMNQPAAVPEQNQPAAVPEQSQTDNSTNNTAKDQQYKLLLIEDDLFICELYKQQLVVAGFAVDIAMGAGEGIAKINTGIYNLLLLDIMLPGTSGIEILRNMKQDPKTADIPVIIISNLEDETIIKDSLAMGANKFLTKSTITPIELVQIVKETLQNN